MKILMVTPAGKGSRKGNRVTAERWAKMLRGLGHRVEVAETFCGQTCDLLLALHARRSHDSIQKFHDLYPHKPLVVALTGTDLYKDIHINRRAQHSLQLAHRLIILQPRGLEVLPPSVRDKTRVIFQSAVAPRGEIKKSRRYFEVCVIGHLRPVKDPFRAALAVRNLPPESRIRVLHLGNALDQTMGNMARMEMQINPRYRWLGEKPRWQTRRLLARAQLLVHSSIMEGGANVVAEAVVCGVPVLASRISGTIGQLGEDYPGYFPVQDGRTLRNLLLKAENDPQFLKLLKEWIDKLKPNFSPEKEIQAWAHFMKEFE